MSHEQVNGVHLGPAEGGKKIYEAEAFEKARRLKRVKIHFRDVTSFRKSPFEFVY